MGKQFYDGTMPRIARALVTIAARMENDDSKALDRLGSLLDSQQWTADTLDAVAAIVRSTGREIREPK
jgi:hypothetical protein